MSACDVTGTEARGPASVSVLARGNRASSTMTGPCPGLLQAESSCPRDRTTFQSLPNSFDEDQRGHRTFRVLLGLLSIPGAQSKTQQSMT